MRDAVHSLPVPADDEHVDHLIHLFNELFQASENTVLVRGDDEPIYLPADSQHAHARIVFAHGYFASALHEIAHWCIAGPERRKLVDFGYWYAPDGRDAEQQQVFEGLEIKPQAIEWMLAKAAGFRYRVSCDNLLSGPFDLQAFKRNIHREVMRRFDEGLPDRTQRLIDTLLAHYLPETLLPKKLLPESATQRGRTLSRADFSIDDL